MALWQSYRIVSMLIVCSAANDEKFSYQQTTLFMATRKCDTF